VGATVQHKVFKIERMLPQARRLAGERPIAASNVPHARDDVLRMRQALQRARQELTATMDARLQRMAEELKSIRRDTDSATHTVLGEIEQIDDMAKTLAAALKSEQHRALAQDIQEHATRIYEACNFQDIAGQRIANALLAIEAVESQLARAAATLDERVTTQATTERNALVNGPRLTSDTGHASQDDVDLIFSET
jgi:chemotaxis protein CheZ